MRLSLKSLRFLLAHGALALLLLFSQQHASVHRLAHAVEATQSTRATRATPAIADGALDRHCTECGALAALDAAAPVTALAALALQSASASAPARLLATAQAAVTWPAFRSRAPPNLS